MSKNRSRSPFTGSKKLSKDPHEAGAIRQALANNIRDLAAVHGNDPVPINLKPTSYLSVLQPGVTLRISLAMIEVYGIELVKKDILQEVTRDKDGSFIFIATKQGWPLIRRGHVRLAEAPKVIVTTDLATRQKSLASERVKTPSVVRPVERQKFGPERDRDLPAARELLIPLLQLANEAPIKSHTALNLLANRVGFPRKRVHLPNPIDTNQTFSLVAHHALKYLLARRLLARKSKSLKITPHGRDAVALGGNNKWPDLVEPAVKRRNTIIHKLPTEARQAHHEVRLDAERALQGIQEAEPLKLIAKWENAHRILADANKKEQHELVRLVIERLEEEWQRRNASSNPEDYFEWPTSEANGGDGSLSLEDILKHGPMSAMDYHVGRARGRPDAYRRRTLAKIFEQPFPGDLSVLERDEWGPKGSAKRLRKMAYSIAAFTRSAKRRNRVVLDDAIRQWEADLRFLHDQYYVGKFSFGWPSTIVRAEAA